MTGENCWEILCLSRHWERKRGNDTAGVLEGHSSNPSIRTSDQTCPFYVLLKVEGKKKKKRLKVGREGDNREQDG